MGIDPVVCVCVSSANYPPICSALLERKPCLCPTLFLGQPMWFCDQSFRKSSNLQVHVRSGGVNGSDPQNSSSHKTPEDPHTTRSRMGIDPVVCVCVICQLSANLLGPAGAKAMSVSNFVSRTTHVVLWPTVQQKTEIYINNFRSRNINGSDPPKQLEPENPHPTTPTPFEV